MTSQSLKIEEPINIASQPEEAFQSDKVLAITGGHFVHDGFSGFLAPLLPVLQERLETNYALTGGLAIYARLPSLLNPFIGYLADKVSLRYFVIFAPAVTATLMSSLGLASSYFSLVLLLLAVGVSIAAFHAPAPAMIGQVAGPRIGTGMSIFMAGGELGRAVGPLVLVAGIEWFGLGGIWRLAIIGWLVSAILYFRLHDIAAHPRPKDGTSLRRMWPKIRRIFAPLTVILITRGFIVVALSIYLPLFMSDVVGSSLWLAAASLTILEGAGVVGALLTGTLSDRFGRVRMLLFLLGVAPFLLFGFLYAPSWLAVPFLIGLGLTAISPTPVLLAVVQDNFTENRALANGIFMGINFLTYAIAVSVIGLIADQLGLFNAFLSSGIIALFAWPAVLKLPN